jgi:hypothetical protein
MFGLTKREQRWKAEQQAAELLVGFASTVARAAADVSVAEAMADATELQRLRAENAELRTMLTRYRLEVPLGNQPHMLAHAVDVALGRA